MSICAEKGPASNLSAGRLEKQQAYFAAGVLVAAGAAGAAGAALVSAGGVGAGSFAGGVQPTSAREPIKVSKANSFIVSLLLVFQY